MNTLWSFFGKGSQVKHAQNEDIQTEIGDGFPVPNHTLSYWRSELHHIDSYCSSEQLPSECDIAIVGAGMTGVSTAYHLSRLHAASGLGKKQSIVVLDAREVCSGATGRNGVCLHRVMQDRGLDAANEIAAFVSAQKYHMKDAVDREGLSCEFEMRRSYDVFVDRQEAVEAEQLYRTAVKEGYQWARDLDFVGPEIAEQLLSRLVDSGVVTLYTNTPVLSIDSSDALSTVLHTPRGSLTTKRLIFATNAYTPAICLPYKDEIVPYKGTACHIKPENPVSPHLSHTYNISYDHPADQATRVDYLNPRPDSGIVVGGAKFCFDADKDCWHDTTDDSTLLPNVRPYFTTYMQSNFKGWEKSNAKITHLWTGIQGETKDGFPFVGKVPGKKNWFIAAGFNGGGMSFIFSCSAALAEMVDGKTYEETRLPKMFDAERMAD
ncbi:FAD dependent oxidoreductase [Aureobasidium sp. EXF-10727]|nr:FAD dependent oxidoreductase [Aureobasidium sp. EXF-10727]